MLLLAENYIQTGHETAGYEMHTISLLPFSQIDLSSFMPILGQHYKMLSADSIRIFFIQSLPVCEQKKEIDIQHTHKAHYIVKHGYIKLLASGGYTALLPYWAPTNRAQRSFPH